jgi:hypothetical protein
VERYLDYGNPEKSASPFDPGAAISNWSIENPRIKMGDAYLFDDVTYS